MEQRKPRHLFVRLINACSSLTVIAAVVYILFAGFTLTSTAVVTVAVVVLAAPVVSAGGSLVEMLSGILEAFIQGLMAIFDVIGSVISGLAP